MKKQHVLVLGSMALLVAAACVLNYRLSGLPGDGGAQDALEEDAQQVSSMTQSDALQAGNAAEDVGAFFTLYKQDRAQKRADEVTYLDSILSDAQADAQTRASAQQLLLQVTESMEQELAVETLLHAGGYPHSAVVFHDGTVSVIVGQETLDADAVAGILTIVMQETGQSAENVKIIPVE